MATTYDIGDRVRLTVTFTDTGGSQADPTSFKLNIDGPDTGAATQYTNTSTAVVKVTTGQYRFDMNTTARGLYQHRWTSTGSVVQSVEGWFSVRPRRVTT